MLVGIERSRSRSSSSRSSSNSNSWGSVEAAHCTILFGESQNRTQLRGNAEPVQTPANCKYRTDGTTNNATACRVCLWPGWLQTAGRRGTFGALQKQNSCRISTHRDKIRAVLCTTGLWPCHRSSAATRNWLKLLVLRLCTYIVYMADQDLRKGCLFLQSFQLLTRAAARTVLRGQLAPANDNSL